MSRPPPGPFAARARFRLMASRRAGARRGLRPCAAAAGSLVRRGGASASPALPRRARVRAHAAARQARYARPLPPRSSAERVRGAAAAPADGERRARGPRSRMPGEALDGSLAACVRRARARRAAASPRACPRALRAAARPPVRGRTESDGTRAVPACRDAAPIARAWAVGVGGAARGGEAARAVGAAVQARVRASSLDVATTHAHATAHAAHRAPPPPSEGTCRRSERTRRRCAWRAFVAEWTLGGAERAGDANAEAAGVWADPDPERSLDEPRTQP